MLVHFFELSGLQAKEQLRDFRDRVASLEGITSLELLESLEQPNLFLLVIKSLTPLDLNPPLGTRAWIFSTSSF